MPATSRPYGCVRLLVFLYLLKEHFTLCASKDCYEALSECNNDTKCSDKLKDYAQECGTIVELFDTFYSSPRFPCSKACVSAIKSLKRTTRGRALWECNCNLDAHCLTLKKRTAKCLAISNGTHRKRTSCTKALRDCMMDAMCQKAQMVFLLNCSKMFSLTACTNQCLCSQKRLFSLARGRPLMDCECDGSDETYCVGLRANAEHMKCNWKNRRVRKRLRRRCKRCRQRKGDKKCVRRTTRKRRN